MYSYVFDVNTFKGGHLLWLIIELSRDYQACQPESQPNQYRTQLRCLQENWDNNVLKAAREQNISWPFDANQIDSVIEQLLFPKQNGKQAHTNKRMPDSGLRSHPQGTATKRREQKAPMDRIPWGMCFYPVIGFHIRKSLCASVHTAWKNGSKYICRYIPATGGIINLEEKWENESISRNDILCWWNRRTFWSIRKGISIKW